MYFCFVTDRHEQPVSSEKSAASKEGGPIPPYTFDVSTLLPVKKSSSATPVKPPKVIELVDKGTNLVLCCFRGVTKAHRALNVERSFATMACLNYGTPFQPDLGDYILRYVQNADLCEELNILRTSALPKMLLPLLPAVMHPIKMPRCPLMTMELTRATIKR